MQLTITSLWWKYHTHQMHNIVGSPSFHVVMVSSFSSKTKVLKLLFSMENTYILLLPTKVVSTVKPALAICLHFGSSKL